MKKDIGESFEDLKNSMYEKIDTGGGSILVHKAKNEETGQNGYMWSGEWYPTKEAVVNATKGIFMQISLRIVNPNGEVKQLGPEYTDMYHNRQSPYDKFIQDGKDENK